MLLTAGVVFTEVEVCAGFGVAVGAGVAVFGSGGGDWFAGCTPDAGLPPVPRLVPGVDFKSPTGGVLPVLLLPVSLLPVVRLPELLLPGFLLSGGFAMVTPLVSTKFSWLIQCELFSVEICSRIFADLTLQSYVKLLYLQMRL